MANKYAQQLTSITIASGNFVIPICDDPSGTSELRKVTVTDLLFPASGNATMQGNIFNTASKLVQLTAANKYPALDGSLITNISGGVTSVAGRGGPVVLTNVDIGGLGQAALYNSGTIFLNTPMSGTPTAPTAAVNTNTTQLATTAFVTTAVTNASGGVKSVSGRTGVITLSNTDISGLGQAALYNSGQIFLNSPLSGVPTAPTAANGTNTTQLATTAFVSTAITNASGGVSSVAGRTGAITLVESDVSNLVSDLASKAYINNPALNGTIIFSGIITNSILKVNGSNVLTSGVIGVDYVVPAITTVYSGQHYLTPVNLTSGSTVNWNMDTAPNAILRVPSGVFTMANPTNIRAGAGGMLTIIQPAIASGSGIISWGSAYKFAGGTKFVLSGPANSRDTLSWYSYDGTVVDIVGGNAFA